MPRKAKPSPTTQNSANTTYTTQSSRLLSLPPELRNWIFFLLCAQTLLEYQRPTNFGRTRASREGLAYNPDRYGSHPYIPTKQDLAEGKPSAPGFMMVCKQIYYEFLEVLYATATFEFAVQRVLNSWIRSVRLSHLKLVKNVLLYDTPIEEGSLVVKKKKRTAQWTFYGGRTNVISRADLAGKVWSCK